MRKNIPRVFALSVSEEGFSTMSKRIVLLSEVFARYERKKVLLMRVPKMCITVYLQK